MDFPTLRIGSRMVAPKEKFILWVEKHTAVKSVGVLTDRSLITVERLGPGAGEKANIAWKYENTERAPNIG